jgi:hypothetical protein
MDAFFFQCVAEVTLDGPSRRVNLFEPAIADESDVQASLNVT